MNLKPLGDRVVIEHVEQAEKSAGGVFLPDTAKEKPQEGIVRAVGTGRVLDNGTKLPMNVKVGDRSHLLEVLRVAKSRSTAKSTSSSLKKTFSPLSTKCRPASKEFKN